MQAALNTPATPHATPEETAGDAANTAANAQGHYQIIRRNGAVVPFEAPKIAIALMKAFLAVRHPGRCLGQRA
jgi:ribonucleoside-diphosphate reductase alpha chain